MRLLEARHEKQMKKMCVDDTENGKEGVSLDLLIGRKDALFLSIV